MADEERGQQGQQQSHSPACSLAPHRHGRAVLQTPEGHTPCPLALEIQTNKGEHQEDCVETSGQTSRPLGTTEPEAEQRSRSEVDFCVLTVSEEQE